MDKLKKNTLIIIFSLFTLLISYNFIYLVNQDDYDLVKQIKLSNNLTGDIYDDNDTLLLTTDKKGTMLYDDDYAYNYLLGYATNSHGNSGLLKAFNEELHDAPYSYNKGAAMYTTINAVLQKKCYSLLEGLEGSIIVLERNSGKIKAIASCSGNDFNIKDIYNKYEATAKGDVLIDRATYTKEAVGSTFKSVISALAIEHKQDDLIINDITGFTKFDDHTIHNFNNNAHGKTNLIKALNKSSNVYFSSLALNLGVDNLNSLESKFCFNKKIKLDYTAIDSTFDLGNTNTDLALIGLGQGKLAMSPLHLAMVYQGLADGTMYKPYVVEKIERVDNKLLYTSKKEILSECFDNYVIDTLDDYLLQNGQSYGLSKKLKIRAKTGTAQITAKKDHSYVASYDDNYVVVVSINNGELSSQKLLPIVEKVFARLNENI